MRKSIYFNNKIEVIAEIADTPAKLSLGLQRRQSLADHEGMLFKFPSDSFHRMWMKNTLIPLDMIFIDSKFDVVDLKQGNPNSSEFITPERPCRYVLEVPQGFVVMKKINIGDKVRNI